MANFVVVGAGLSGLVTARRLQERGATVVVLEARDRVGGRMYAQQVNNAVIDLGGQWVGPTQKHILALAQDLKIDKKIFDQYHNGSACIKYGGGVYVDDNEYPAPNDHDRDQVKALLKKFEDAAAPINLTAPWESNNADVYDQSTLGQWIEANTQNDYAKFYVGVDVTFNQSGGSPREVSLLHALLERRANPPEDEPDKSLFRDSAGQIPQLMVDTFKINVRHRSRVVTISQDLKGAQVTTADQKTYESAAVIVAMPPSLTAAIHYNPGLPARRVQLASRMAMGTIAKIACIYQGPWWRTRGYSGAAVGDNTMTVRATTDSGLLEMDTPGILTSFIQGYKLVEWSALDAKTRKEQVIRDLETYFGKDAGTLEHEYIEMIWPQEQFTGGAYNGYLPPGGWTSYGSALRQPVDRIFWAGTETATHWYGYFDGAVEAGERAAKEALEHFG